MDAGLQYAHDAHHVVHETIDGETILIHLGTGVYYSLEGDASTVWTLAATGVPAGGIVAHLQAAHPAHADDVEPAVAELLARLTGEGLLVEDGATPVPEVAPPVVGNGFRPLVLQRYTDMQDFMLVDPLHEVDEQAGWPNVKPR